MKLDKLATYSLLQFRFIFLFNGKKYSPTRTVFSVGKSF